MCFVGWRDHDHGIVRRCFTFPVDPVYDGIIIVSVDLTRFRSAAVRKADVKNPSGRIDSARMGQWCVSDKT